MRRELDSASYRGTATFTLIITITYPGRCPALSPTPVATDAASLVLVLSMWDLLLLEKSLLGPCVPSLNKRSIAVVGTTQVQASDTEESRGTFCLRE